MDAEGIIIEAKVTHALEVQDKIQMDADEVYTKMLK